VDSGSTATAGRGTARRTERILVVDDIEDNRQLLIRRLQREGFGDIAAAADGAEALEFIARQPFDLVLLDVMMPRVDGYQVLERLRADGRLHELPVIVISALNEIDSAVRCIQLGAVDYLPKPFNATLLRAQVGATLEQKKLRDEVRAHLTRLEQELAAARALQMSMVPTEFPPPERGRGVEIFAVMEPAHEVGGDLYDFFFTSDGRLAFLIGDVSGKGVAAAMFMARTVNLLRVICGFMLADGKAATPGEIIGRLNGELCAGNTTMTFVTLFFGVLDPPSGALAFCNAGHEPPFRLAAGHVAPLAGAQGLVLGIDESWAYDSAAMTLTPDETLCLFTDGITEAIDPAQTLFGKDRLAALLAGQTDAPPEALVRCVVAAVNDFAQGAPQADDITALALRRPR
jgi:phosphoserine phosphatase RsbU/P